MQYSITIRREMPQRPKVSINEQIKLLLLHTFEGSRHTWACTDKKVISNSKNNGTWVGMVTLFFEKVKGKRSDLDVVEKQWQEIKEQIIRSGSHSRFNKYSWIVVEDDATEETADEDQEMSEEEMAAALDEELGEPVTTEKIKDVKKVVPPGVHDVIISGQVLTIEDIKRDFPHDLLNGTDEYIENHEVFRGVYGRAPQIRSLLSTIWSFVESDGERANHTLLWGLPACAKTEILLRLIKLFGEGAVLRLDSTSTTRAGLEKLIFKELEYVPPIFISEEIEKADEQALRIWLGAMDDRHEFRKVNFHQHQVRKVYFLSLATANDKDKFDMMMGGRAGYPGALSSRFVHQLECPRPNESQMRLILRRDIERFGGKMEWIEPCITLARKIGTDDPRKVLGFLDGGDRLLNRPIPIRSVGHLPKGRP